MQPSFKDFSSWRINDITVKGFEHFALDFLDTSPNQFVIQNPNDVVLYVGLSQTPTENNYEFKVGRNATVPVGRPTPTRKLYIYNPLGDDVNLKIFSVYLPFDFSMLMNNTMNVEHAEIQTDGIVRGFANGVTLPRGTNLLGKVGLDTEEKQFLETIQNWFVSKANDIWMDIDTIRALSTNMVNKLKILSMIEMPEIFEDVPHVYENNVLEINYTATEKGIFCLNYLFNDGASVLNIKRNDDYLLTVLEGEKISDFKVNLEIGDIINITGSEPMIRAEHYFIKQSLINL